MAEQYGQIPGGGRPYGNIYSFNPTAIDRAGQQLYLEQKQRDLLRQKQQQALDEEFSKNIANIRDADVDEYVSQYSKYKKSKQDLMRMKPKNQEEYIKKQMESQRELSNLMKLGAASKRAKSEEEDITKEYLRNPDSFDDNAPSYLAIRRNTPLSGFKYKINNNEGGEDIIDLGDYNTYRYKGSDTDFGKLVSDAAGIPRPVYHKEVPVDKEGRQTDIIPYLFGNTPSEVKSQLMGNFSIHKAGRSAEYKWSQIPEEEVKKTIEDYMNIPPEKWQKMGLKDKQDLIPKNSDSKAEKYASYLAMKYAIENEPNEGTPIRRNNQAAIDERNFQQQKEMAAYNDKLARGRLALQDAFIKSRINLKKAQTEADADNVLNRFIQKQYDAGTSLTKEGKEYSSVTVNGKTYKGKYVNVPKSISGKYTKTFNEGGKSVKAEPDVWFMTEDKSIIPLFYSGDKTKSGTPTFSPGSKPIDVLTYKADLRPILLSVKDGSEAVLEEFPDEETEVTEKGILD